MPKVTKMVVTRLSIQFEPDEIETLLTTAVGRPQALVLWDADHGCRIEFETTQASEEAPAPAVAPAESPRVVPATFSPNPDGSIGPALDLGGIDDYPAR